MVMTFKKYYLGITKRLKKTLNKKPSKKYIKILWGYSYTVDLKLNE